MLNLIFPRKCTLCRTILATNETDLCHACRKSVPEFRPLKRKIPFIAHWISLWYYKDTVRQSIHRFKFGKVRKYGDVYARCLALRLHGRMDTFDLVTWVPMHFWRYMKRGFNQSAQIAAGIGRELDLPVHSTLMRTRHTPPQSGISSASMRRVNVLGAFRAMNADFLKGKRILLIDDVVTTGATASECARVLVTAGAKEVTLATVAATEYHKK